MVREVANSNQVILSTLLYDREAGWEAWYVDFGRLSHEKRTDEILSSRQACLWCVN